ncbi:hypothetical protein [Zobellia russellii]|uniref:hypothetical protein n=1 Tax=Zobellia russellii TaxID=248907 RepID=UPI001BFF56E0|nr:hypothetical protein [Zobellia russellii]MBT9187403.1 hypothetical protein [Zobellia russellii]
MTNIYWPVYKNLEKEFLDLTYSIHIDDNQLEVYSSKISDLILRSAIEIESISKELYYREGGKEIKNIKFDIDALKYLNNKWILEEKIVFISSLNCFLSEDSIQPFKKKATKHSGRLTYNWNNAYQHLKHNRGENLRYGCLKNLFEILAALYILNIYYKKETLELGSEPGKFSGTLGSKFFSIKVHRNHSINQYGIIKDKDFEQCTYFIAYTKEIKKVIQNIDYSNLENLASQGNKVKLLEWKLDAHRSGLFDTLQNLKFEAILNENNINT